MTQYKMTLTDEQKAILEGKSGETMAKVLKTIVMYGEIFGAKRLVPVTHKQGHLVTSFGLGVIKPVYKIMDELIKDKIVVEGKFSVDPRPLDYENVKCNLLEKFAFSKKMYNMQDAYESQLMAIGLKDKNAFTCACYLPEVGNTPTEGDIISWAESSAVVYANSVLGARCNRNSGVLELFGSIVGVTPEFGLLTDKGRKATWRVIVKTSSKPEAQVLGSAIGMKVMEDVPYIIGLDKYIGNKLDEKTKSYLKDFGAATASNGAVGLYHIDNLTPEAKKLGEKLIDNGAKEYIIDDKELERVYKSYPVMWKKEDAKPNLCFIGCPHLSFGQLNDWTIRILNALEKNGEKRVKVRTIITSAPDVVEKFKSTENYNKLMETGVKLSSICPLMYTNNPLTKIFRRIITNSNKLRTYSSSRYYKDNEILDIITGRAR